MNFLGLIIECLTVCLQGWSLFTSSVTKAARTATESAVRYGGMAAEKVSEMASTVTEKVRLIVFINCYVYLVRVRCRLATEKSDRVIIAVRYLFIPYNMSILGS